MLREETKASDRPWSRPRRALAASLLLAVAAGALLLLHGPLRADDPSGRAASASGHVLGEPSGAVTVQRSMKPFDLSYVIDDDSQGIVGFRPAAAFGRSGMGSYRTMLNVVIGQQWAKAANALKFDATKPGQKPLRVDLFEQVAASVRVYRIKSPKPNGRMALSMMTVRTTEPVNWVALGRLFRMKISEVRDRDRVYYRVKDAPLAPEMFFFCPDDRTLVVTGDESPADAEKRLLKHLRRDPTPSAGVRAGEGLGPVPPWAPGRRPRQPRGAPGEARQGGRPGG